MSRHFPQFNKSKLVKISNFWGPFNLKKLCWVGVARNAYNPTKSMAISFSLLFISSLLPHVNKEEGIFPTFEQNYDTIKSLIFSSQPCKQVYNIRLQSQGGNLILDCNPREAI